MKNGIIKFSFIIFCVLISCVLFGCKKEGIKFYRESKVQELMHGFQEQNDKNKDVIKRSSGIIIYKDNSNKNSNNQSINFGPKDLNFDLKIK